MILKSAQVEKFLKKPDPALRCFVVYGANEGLISETVRGLARTVAADFNDPFAVSHLSGAVDEGTMSAEFNSRSLMGGRRCMVVRDAADGLAKTVKKLLETSESDTLLVLSSSALAKRSALVKLAEEREDCAAAACYEDRDEDVYSTARNAFISKGYTIANDALTLLCTRLSADRKSNLGEIDKLLVYIGDRRNVVLEDVAAAVSDVSMSKVEDIAYFAAGGQVQKALESFAKTVSEGEEPVGIARSLSYHFAKLIQCKASMESGETAEKAMAKLTPRVIFFREAAFKKQLAVWPKERLLDVMDLLYKCERDCKTTNLPGEEMASYCIMQISGAAAKMRITGA